VGRTVFISYTKSDEDWAKLFGNELEEMGHTVVAMYKGFEGDFISRIEEAFDECDSFILVCSPDYEQSGYCSYERHVVLKMEIEERKRILHPIKVYPYDVSHSIAIHTYIDLSTYAPGSPEARSYFREEISKKFEEVSSGTKPYTIHNLPYRFPNFTGRNQIIETLHDHFTSESPENNIQALTGLGGVGKTKISLEYASRYLSHYQLIWFFNAEDKTTLRQEISDIAKTLQLPEARQENNDLHIAAFRKYLDEHDKWLIIFDNATSPNDLEGILPRLPRGNIIITSRTPQWGSHACILPINPFSEKESIEYLEKRLHRKNERPCFETVSNNLDCIPIALDIAAAYMDTNQISCEEYRSVIEETLSPLSPLKGVWTPSISKIKTKSCASISLLEYLTHFSPDNIPEEVLYPALKLTPDLSENLKTKAGYLETLSLLLQYSLLSKDLNTRALSMHRIVQTIVREIMDDKTKREKAASTVEIFSQLFPIKSDDPETIDSDMWIKCHQILPHAVYAAGIADELRISTISTLHLYAQIASFLRELENLMEENEYAEESPKIASLYKDTIPHASSLKTTARILRGKEQNTEALKEAEQYAKKSLKIASLYKDTIHHAISLETMARILRDQGRNIEAQDLMIEAIRIEEDIHNNHTDPDKSKSLESYQAHLAVCYDGYGRILSNLGRSEESLSFYTNALSLDKKFYGEKHPKIAIRKNNIACAYGQMGKDDQEIQYLRDALQIEEEYYGGNHPHIAIRLGNLALVYERVKNQSAKGSDCIDRAREYWERAFTIDHQFYGLGHHHTLSRMYGLAGNYCKKNDFEKALEWNNKAIDISKIEAPDGYHHGMGILHRGNTYAEMKDYSSALKDYEDALSIITKSRGMESNDRSIVLKYISYLKGQQEDYSSAADYLEKALQIDELNNQTQNRGYIISLMNLGFYYSQSGDDAKAKSCLAKALPLIEYEFGEKSQNYLITLILFINTKISTKDLDGIQDLIKKHKKIRKEIDKT